MIIKNFRELASTKLRRDALEIINAGVEAALVGNIMKQDIKVSKGVLKIGNKIWKLQKNGSIFVVGAGKASADMARVIEEKFGKRIKQGIVIDTRNVKLKKIRVVKGTHPLPSQTNINATKEIVEILKNAREGDIIINLISGGGSALLAYPRVSLQQLVKVNKLLLDRGADIGEINAVRKHISKIKGGQLSELAGKAKVITLIVSDVITNDLYTIASGPSVRDPTTIKEAKRIQKKYSLPELSFVETPKKKLSNTTNILLITNVRSAEAMKKKAKSLGYKTRILGTQIKGESRDIGRKLALMSRKGKAIIGAGETTVTIKGNGKGGRNQELALSASRYLKEGVLVSCSTDGVDFITEAGGGVVDSKTKEKAKKLGLDADEFLRNNDSYNFLKKVNSVIKTGKTGTNVGDLMLVLGEK